MFYLKCLLILILIRLLIHTDLKIDFLFPKFLNQNIQISFVVKIMSLIFFLFLFEISSNPNWWILIPMATIVAIFKNHERIIKYFVRNQIKAHELAYLDSVILTASSGVSVFESLKSSVSIFPRHMQSYFTESLIRIKMSDLNKFPDLWKGFSEIDQILKSNHRQIDQLRSFRRTVYLKDVLSRKKQAALSLVHTQMLVISFMYGLGCIFVFSRYGLSQINRYFCLSVVLFIMSLVSIRILKGLNPWKI